MHVKETSSLSVTYVQPIKLFSERYGGFVAGDLRVRRPSRLFAGGLQGAAPRR
jgi:hypothetical protein